MKTMNSTIPQGNGKVVVGPMGTQGATPVNLEEIAERSPMQRYDAGRFAPRDEEALERLATRWYKSGLLPEAYYPEDKARRWEARAVEWGVSRAVIVMRYGAALGVLPELAIRLIYIVEGQPSPAAALMLAMAFSSGALKREDWNIVEAGRAKVRIELFGSSRPGKPQAVETKIEDYKHLANRKNWQMYPEDMLLARATSRAMRRYFPDMFAGVYAAEERVDFRADPSGRDDSVERIMAAVGETKMPEDMASPSSPTSDITTVATHEEQDELDWIEACQDRAQLARRADEYAVAGAKSLEASARARLAAMGGGV